MPIINHRQFGRKTRRRGKRLRNVSLYTLAALAVLFVLVNVGLMAAYHNKALPGYSVGATSVGGKTFTQIDAILRTQTLPTSVQLQHGSTKATVTLSKMGVAIDRPQTLQAIKAKPLITVTALFKKHVIPIKLAANQKQMTESLSSYGTIFSQRATDKHVVFNGTAFVAESAQPGYSFDQAGTTQAILTALGQGKTTVSVKTSALPAGSNIGDLTADITTLQKQLATKLTFNYGSGKVTPSNAEVASWYATSGQTLAPSSDNIGAYVDKAAKQLHITPANRSDLITATKYALGKNLSMNFEISPAPATMRTYCTATRGVSDSELPDLIGKLAATYADVRGWNDGGKIAFQHVDSGCDYTVWLATPAEMTSFGSICDDYYNCQVGSGVVVNNDRWLYATDPWNKTGQNIETYRVLIIDHETGHRLGFYDNPTCPGTGQLAPVMMQQSIDLKGCTFNIWPLPSEFDFLRDDLHVVS